MFFAPMLLQKSPNAFDDDSYFVELKLDGVRLILSKFDDKVKLYTRHKNDVTVRFPELSTIDIPNGTVLDGEIIVTDPAGKPDFEAMMSRFHSSKSFLDNRTLSYVVFDVIQYLGKSVTHLPLKERKLLLNEILVKDTSLVSKMKYIEGYGTQYFDLVCQQDLEGIVLKRKDSRYEIGKRSNSWLKVINYKYDDVRITGIKKGDFGFLLSFPNGKSAGLMEFMQPAVRKELYQRYRTVSEDDKFIYIEPINCRVKYRNLTKAGFLRIPSFVEWN